MKKKSILKLVANVTELLIMVIKKEISDSQKEARRIPANGGVNTFERAQQETN